MYAAVYRGVGRLTATLGAGASVYSEEVQTSESEVAKGVFELDVLLLDAWSVSFCCDLLFLLCLLIGVMYVFALV